MTSWGKTEGFLLAVSKGGRQFELINRVHNSQKRFLCLKCIKYSKHQQTWITSYIFNCQIRITRVSSNTCVLVNVNLISVCTVDADFPSTLKMTLKEYESIVCFV